MTIRKFTIDDYEKVYTLWMSCKNMGFNNIDDSKEGITKLIERNPNTCFVAVNENNEIKGTVLSGNDGRRGYVYHTCVAEDCRHQKIGEQLVKTMLDGMRSEGISKVALVAFKYNDGGNAFWEKMGFTLREDINYRNISLVELTRIDT